MPHEGPIGSRPAMRVALQSCVFRQPVRGVAPGALRAYVCVLGNFGKAEWIKKGIYLKSAQAGELVKEFRRLFDDRGHLHEATIHHPQLLRRRKGEIKHPSFGEGAAVIDHDDHTALRSWIGHAQSRAERKAAMSGSEFRRIVAIPASRPSRVVGAVISSQS